MPRQSGSVACRFWTDELHCPDDTLIMPEALQASLPVSTRREPPIGTMKRRKRSPDQYMRLSYDAVRDRLYNGGIEPADFKRAAGISDEAWANVEASSRISWETAKRVAEALGETSLVPIMHPSKLAGLSGLSPMPSDTLGLPDWEAIPPWLAVRNAPNGLRYVVWKLRQQHERERYARGKQYDLHLLPTKEQGRLKEYLARHSDICNLVDGHPRFPRHMTTIPDPQGHSWWVIDEWIAGKTLLESICEQELKNIPRLMREIAEGLGALHAADVIRRELAPWNILLREVDGSVVLTDFELGKLLDEAPTVSADWPEDLYRAPEVGPEPLTKNDLHVDLYSWARILQHCVMGKEALRDGNLDSIDRTDLPPKVRSIVKRCLSEPRKRPKRIEDVLKVIQSWDE